MPRIAYLNQDDPETESKQENATSNTQAPASNVEVAETQFELDPLTSVFAHLEKTAAQVEAGVSMADLEAGLGQAMVVISKPQAQVQGKETNAATLTTQLSSEQATAHTAALEVASRSLSRQPLRARQVTVVGDAPCPSGIENSGDSQYLPDIADLLGAPQGAKHNQKRKAVDFVDGGLSMSSDVSRPLRKKTRSATVNRKRLNLDDDVPSAQRHISKSTPVVFQRGTQPSPASTNRGQLRPQGISPDSRPRLSTKNPHASARLSLVLSSTVERPDKGLRTFLAKHNVHVRREDDGFPTKRTNYACVITNDRIKTAKVLRSLIADKPVIMDVWMHDSLASGSLKDMQDYVPARLKVISGERARDHVFDGVVILFTPYAASTYDNFGEICSLLLEAGAERVEKYSDGQAEKLSKKSRILLVGECGLKDEVSHQLLEARQTVYDKHVLAQAILYPSLDLDADEYKLALFIT